MWRRQIFVLMLASCLPLNMVSIAAKKDSAKQPAKATSYRSQLAIERASFINDRGVDFYLAKKYKDAIGCFAEAIKLDPQNVEAYSNRGAAYDALRNHERAITDYSSAIKLNPKLIDAYTNRAAAYSDMGQYSKAAADYTRVLRLTRSKGRIYAKRARMYQKLGQLETSLQDYEKAVTLNPRDRDALKNRDLLLKALNKEPKEEEEKEKEKEKDAVASTTGGEQVSSEQQLQKTLSATRAAIASADAGSGGNKRVPISAQTFDEAANPASQWSGDTTSLVKTAPGRATAPTNVQNPAPAAPPASAGITGDAANLCYHVLGNLMNAIGNHKSAIECFSAAAAAKPTDPFALYRRGNVYLRMGDVASAGADFSEALRLKPYFPQARYKLNQTNLSAAQEAEK